MSTLYEALGVRSTADGEAIQRAFYQLARTHHPDRLTTDAATSERFKQITAAYAVLKDPARRAAYDAGLRETRRRRSRDLLICAAAALLSFGGVSGGILLFHDARAAQELALPTPPAAYAEATPQPAEPLRKLPSLAEFIAPIEDTPVPPDVTVTGSTQGPPAATAAAQPTEDAADPPSPTEAPKSAAATTPAMTVVRVWTRPQGTTRDARSGHAAKSFMVPREQPDDPRPSKEGRGAGGSDTAKTAIVRLQLNRRVHD